MIAEHRSVPFPVPLIAGTFLTGTDGLLPPARVIENVYGFLQDTRANRTQTRFFWAGILD